MSLNNANTSIRKSRPSKPSKSASEPSTTRELILTLLKRKGGASLNEICEATGWQRHSVRGFLSRTIKRKLSLELVAEQSEDGVRRYRVAT